MAERYNTTFLSVDDLHKLYELAETRMSYKDIADEIGGGCEYFVTKQLQERYPHVFPCQYCGVDFTTYGPRHETARKYWTCATCAARPYRMIPPSPLAWFSCVHITRSAARWAFMVCLHRQRRLEPSR